jgi:SWIM zinc finger
MTTTSSSSAVEEASSTVVVDTDKRVAKASALLQSGKPVTERPDGTFLVPSQTRPNVLYEVTRFITSSDGELFGCSCPDFQFRGIPECKHILVARKCLEIKEK